jgi:16S rRNA (adenine1518-N6/adenine1519-N6)-dimethyltransferase
MKHRPQKKWGQNFLRNRGAVGRIVAAIEPEPDEVILEIGPGEGALTRELIRYPNPIMAIEVDPQLATSLRTALGDRVEVRNADAVDVDLPDVPFRAVGNLPYNVGTPILRRVIAAAACRRAVFMLQKEVADRTTARPGDEAYGFLALYVQLFATARTLMTLEPGSFHPRPKVRSAVVVLDPRDPGTAADRAELIALISQSFHMRRKRLVNNLEGFRGVRRADAIIAIEKAGLEPGVRAEEMALADFDRLALSLGAQHVAFAPRHTTRSY